MSTATESTEYLGIKFQSLGAEGVDRTEKVIRGMVVAMEGDFVDGRGAFNRQSLSEIAALINKEPKGLKSRWGHPSPDGSGLGSFLGRQRNARLSTTLNRQGQRVACVRADLYLDSSSFKTPMGDLGGYLMALAESDPDALSSSLVIQPRIEQRRGQSPVWYPVVLKSSDIVEEGAAVGSLLESCGDAKQQLEHLLDSMFVDDTREVVEASLSAYLDRKFPTPKLNAIQERLDAMKAKVAK